MEDTGRRAGDFVLIVGGSGYLGLHLLEELSGANSPFQLAFTYHSHPPPPSFLDKLEGVQAFKVDLVSGEGLDAVATALGPPRVVVNCAAVSVPRECEMDPSLAMAVNCPSALVQWLHSFGGQQSSLLIHLSTDQVYEGSRSYYKEVDETKPVNVYGKSKVTAEQFIHTHCSKFAILRSSIIYGPQPLLPVQKSLPIQVIDNLIMDLLHVALRSGVMNGERSARSGKNLSRLCIESRGEKLYIDDHLWKD